MLVLLVISFIILFIVIKFTIITNNAVKKKFYKINKK
jgi:hypothetical protein